MNHHFDVYLNLSQALARISTNIYWNAQQMLAIALYIKVACVCIAAASKEEPHLRLFPEQLW
jgi:hypothetical protein